MREGKLREIFEECLTAVLDGRRTVEDCLSLYPSIASELEPLLRTSVEVSDAYQAETPPWHVQERIRHRVLAAAQARARSRTLVSGINLSPKSWRARHWSGLGAAAAAAVAAVSVVSIVLLSGGSDGAQVVQDTPPVTVEVVADLRQDVADARQLLQAEGRIDPGQIERLAASLESLATEYPDFAAFDALPLETQLVAKETLAEVPELFTEIVIDDPVVPPELDGLRDLLDRAKILEEQWGKPVPVTPVPTDVPEATETSAPSEEPTETGAPEPTPTKEPAPSEAPESTEAAVSDDDPIRVPQ